MKKKIITSIIAYSLLQSIPSNVLANESKPLIDLSDKDRWVLRARVINVDPDEDSKVTGLSADVKAKHAFTPELDFTYFFTKNIAAELILATSKHNMGTNSGVDLGDVWVLPPTLNMQYHIMPESKIRPYVGAGLGYIFYYNADSGAVNNIKYENGISYSLQAGADFEINQNWALNADVKKLFHNTDVSINNGAITADVDLNPWVFGMGIAYRF